MEKIYTYIFNEGWKETENGHMDRNEAIVLAIKLLGVDLEVQQKTGKKGYITSSIFDGKLAFTLHDSKYKIISRYGENA